MARLGYHVAKKTKLCFPICTEGEQISETAWISVPFVPQWPYLLSPFRLLHCSHKNLCIWWGTTVPCHLLELAPQKRGEAAECSWKCKTLWWQWSPRGESSRHIAPLFEPGGCFFPESADKDLILQYHVSDFFVLPSDLKMPISFVLRVQNMSKSFSER